MGKAVVNLVLGSSGFVGAPFCKYLRGLGEEVVEYDMKKSPGEDLRYDQTLNWLVAHHDVTHIYLLAWDVGGSKYLYRDDTQLAQIEWNVGILQNTMPQVKRAIDTYGVKFLFVSSQLAKNPDAYGTTKALGETWTKAIGGTAVRLWNVYGPLEEPSERSHVVSDFVYQAVKTGAINLKDPDVRRRFIHIDDASRGLRLAIENPSKTGHPYDLCPDEDVSIKDLARMTIRALQEDGRAVPLEQKHPGWPPDSMAWPLPNWSCEVSLLGGLKRMVTELRSILYP